MFTTKKRMSISLTREDLRQLNDLAKFFEETPSVVIKRALAILFYTTFKEKKCQDNQSM